VSTCQPILPAEMVAVQRRLAAAEGFTALRCRAIFEMGVATGYRIAEVLSLNVGDVVTADGRISTWVEVRRRATKGRRRSRRMPLPDRARMAIWEYLDELRFRGCLVRTEPLFVTRSLKRLSRFHAYREIRGLLEQAGMSRHGGRALGTHTMRKTFALQAHDALRRQQVAGQPVDVFGTMVRLLGHSDPKSTLSYLPFDVENWEPLLRRLPGTAAGEPPAGSRQTTVRTVPAPAGNPASR